MRSVKIQDLLKNSSLRTQQLSPYLAHNVTAWQLQNQSDLMKSYAAHKKYQASISYKLAKQEAADTNLKYIILPQLCENLSSLFFKIYPDIIIAPAIIRFWLEILDNLLNPCGYRLDICLGVNTAVLELQQVENLNKARNIFNKISMRNFDSNKNTFPVRCFYTLYTIFITYLKCNDDDFSTKNGELYIIIKQIISSIQHIIIDHDLLLALVSKYNSGHYLRKQFQIYEAFSSLLKSRDTIRVEIENYNNIERLFLDALGFNLKLSCYSDDINESEETTSPRSSSTLFSQVTGSSISTSSIDNNVVNSELVCRADSITCDQDEDDENDELAIRGRATSLTDATTASPPLIRHRLSSC